jgi:hypothetical protein
MSTRRVLLAAALGVMLGAIPASTVDGQAVTDRASSTFETLYTQLRFDGDGRTVSTGGVTGRIMWTPGEFAGAASSLLGRTQVGFYGTIAPRRNLEPRARFATFELGGAAHVRPLSAPLAGRVDPFLMLGAGVLHTDISAPVNQVTTPLLASSGVSFSVTPGAGAAVRLTPGLALQGELRDVVTFRGDTRHNLALGAGLRMAF